MKKSDLLSQITSSGIRALAISAAMFLMIGCDSEIEEGVMKSDLKKDIELTTDYGVIVFRLSDETPLHRNNMIKLVNQGFYDSLLFHRVVNNFLVQTGDPRTRGLGGDEEVSNEDLNYTVPAEFNESLFHKRGAINAARSDNPARASSSTQFTIIQGRVYTDSTLAIAESRINGWLAANRVANNPANKELYDLQQELRRRRSADSLSVVRRTIDSLVQADLAATPPYRIPESHREIYKTEGGAAHLDQNYTVFGEVISGIEVVDKICAMEVVGTERSSEDIRITKARMIKRR